ncbi:LacI family DNA-binding transcriptional regulator [Amnibacterium endophyticum]|uniref:LacI family DNA-binding transcriptional regulator n=1 Tax=Amnibacterium endophyticum TaxID=2109337 RepID=A0ABW4LAJ9_9MICO
MPASATLHDVAKAAGVSPRTVSNVVNDYPFVSASTRERVLKAIESLGYRPNLAARGLRLGRTGVITLVVPDLRNAYFAELADSVISAAALDDVFVLIEPVGRDRDRELQGLRGPRARLVDGILFSAFALGEEDAHLIDTTTPTVLLGEQIFNAPVDHVTMQNVEASRAATEHILSLGKRRIVALGARSGEVGGSSGLRYRGYLDALEAAGVPHDPELIGETTSWHRADGASSIERMLERGVSFDGIVAFSDGLALGAMSVLQHAGLRIPEDVAIIGFDDTDETRFSLPTLSTVDAGREEIASTAVGLLLDRIRNPNSGEPPRRHFSAYRVIPRESTLGRVSSTVLTH